MSLLSKIWPSVERAAESTATGGTYLVGGSMAWHGMSLSDWQQIVSIACGVLGMLGMLAISLFFKYRKDQRDARLEKLTEKMMRKGIMTTTIRVPNLATDESDG